MERKVRIRLILKIGQENKNGADMLIYEPRADVLMHHLGTVRSLMHAYPLNHPERFMRGYLCFWLVCVSVVGNASMIDLLYEIDKKNN